MNGDYFKLLGMSQALVVDESQLKDAWHRAAALAENPEEVHRAYAVLREPARRIEHLLALQGRKTGGNEKPGATLFDLFFTIGATLKKADDIYRRASEATSALQRAGLTGELLASLDELQSAGQFILTEKDQRKAELTAFSFPNLSDQEWETLATLGNDFSFLSKWENEIRKRESHLQEILIGKIV